jgi:penicillin V acylase-like amidase (Ntn superfamily)
MRDDFTSGSIPFRKAYLQSLIDVIEVDDDQIRIQGRRHVLERVVLPQGHADPEGSQISTKWRAIQDKISNSYIIEITL